jgi:predicted flavoprotein YhiN
LAAELTHSVFEISGKGAFKEEFVTAGGVPLNEVNFSTMESRFCPGLHFAGEILDIDGVTGGFNFQSAWTTGWLAGRALAKGR